MKTETETRWGRVGLLVAVCVAVGWCSFLGHRPVARSAPEAVVALDPAELVVEPGATFSIDVIVRDASELGSYEFTMDFDPAVVRVTGAERGGFLDEVDGSVMTVGPDIDNDAGTLAFGALAVGAAEGAAGSGTLATVTLEAVGEGETPLALRNVQLVSVTAEELPVTTEGARLLVGTGPMPTQTPTGTASTTVTPAPTDDEPQPTATPVATDDEPQPTATLVATDAPDATATSTSVDAATATATVDEGATATTVAPTETEPGATATDEPTDTQEPESTGETTAPEGEDTAAPTDGAQPTVGQAETPAPTGTAPNDGPQDGARRPWLIPAAAILALLGAALIAGGLFLFGPKGGHEQEPGGDEVDEDL